MKHLLFTTLGIFSLGLTIGCSGDDISTPEPTTPEPTTPPVVVTPPNPTEPEEIIGTPCENGFAGIYPCKGYDLIAHVTLEELGFPGSSGNDSWGWTDPTTNKEYAIMGTRNGTAFVDISNPVKPIVLGKLPTAANASNWRDIKVYNNHAFIVADSDTRGRAHPHGIQIFDLTKLRSVTNPPVTFTQDANFQGIQTAHNIVINEQKGYAYATGTSRSGTYRGGATFVDIKNPKNPVAAGGYGDDGYSHDAQVVTYNGPDADYAGKEIYIGSNENEIAIVDVTDKSAPKRISTLSYDDFKYAHQGWFTEDQKYFLLGDELDEQRIGVNTKTIVFDLTDLDAPLVHTEYEGPTPAIDHNGYIKDNIFYQACYTAGVRMIDISGIDGKNLSEVGFFDTYPRNDNANFNGTWNVYPYFKSENIIASNIEDGLFIIRKSKEATLSN